MNLKLRIFRAQRRGAREEWEQEGTVNAVGSVGLQGIQVKIKKRFCVFARLFYLDGGQALHHNTVAVCKRHLLESNGVVVLTPPLPAAATSPDQY